MSEIKDKVVTVESLVTVHEHNKNSYMTKSDPTGTGTLTMVGNGNFSGSLTLGNAVLNYDQVEGALKISFLLDESEIESETSEETTE